MNHSNRPAVAAPPGLAAWYFSDDGEGPWSLPVVLFVEERDPYDSSDTFWRAMVVEPRSDSTIGAEAWPPCATFEFLGIAPAMTDEQARLYFAEVIKDLLRRRERDAQSAEGRAVTSRTMQSSLRGEAGR